MARESKEDAVKRIMDGLKCDRAEAESVYKYDRAIERGEHTEYDLTAEQEQVVSKMKRADRKPTIYKLEKRERKPNATKGAIISALAEWLNATEDFSTENITITNKERQITFQSAGETFELTLVQKRKPKK